MTTTAQAHTENLMKAFNELIRQSTKAFQASWDQTIAAGKLFATATQTEQAEARKTWESAANYARNRNETSASVLKSLFTPSPSDESDPNAETKELLEKLLEQDRTFYQAWTDYMVGFQRRQASLAKDVMAANAEVIEAAQNLAESTAWYGGVVLEGSQAAIKEFSSKPLR